MGIERFGRGEEREEGEGVILCVVLLVPSVYIINYMHIYYIIFYIFIYICIQLDWL